MGKSDLTGNNNIRNAMLQVKHELDAIEDNHKTEYALITLLIVKV